MPLLASPLVSIEEERGARQRVIGVLGRRVFYSADDAHKGLRVLERGVYSVQAPRLFAHVPLYFRGSPECTCEDFGPGSSASKAVYTLHNGKIYAFASGFYADEMTCSSYIFVINLATGESTRFLGPAINGLQLCVECANTAFRIVRTTDTEIDGVLYDTILRDIKAIRLRIDLLAGNFVANGCAFEVGLDMGLIESAEPMDATANVWLAHAYCHFYRRNVSKNETVIYTPRRKAKSALAKFGMKRMCRDAQGLMRIVAEPSLLWEDHAAKRTRHNRFAIFEVKMDEKQMRFSLKMLNSSGCIDVGLTSLFYTTLSPLCLTSCDGVPLIAGAFGDASLNVFAGPLPLFRSAQFALQRAFGVCAVSKYGEISSDFERLFIDEADIVISFE